MTEQFIRTIMRTKDIEEYPELFEAHKRQMAQALHNLYGQEPDWEHFTVHHGRDEPFCTDEEKDLSVMVLWSKDNKEDA